MRYDGKKTVVLYKEKFACVKRTNDSVCAPRKVDSSEEDGYLWSLMIWVPFCVFVDIIGNLQLRGWI